MANFLDASEPEVAALDQQAATGGDNQRLKDMAAASLVSQYGPQAADPEMQQQAITANTDQQTAGDKVQDANLDTDQKQRADEAWQAQHAIAFVRQQVANGVDPAQAVGNLTPETYKALGVNPEQVAPLVSAIQKNPKLLDDIGDALAPIAAQSKMVGSVQWAKGPDGQYHAMYPMQGDDGEIKYQEGANLPAGYSLMGETPEQQQANTVKAGFVPAGMGGSDPGSALKRAILGQESGGNPGVGNSSAGAKGIGQIMPATFAQFAKPGESITNPADNAAVSGRILDSYMQQWGDPARAAVAYFSGPGNVAPAGSKTPYLKDLKDTDGTSTSSYVQGVMGRMGSAGDGAPELTPAAQAKQSQVQIAQARLALAATHEARVAATSAGGTLSPPTVDYLAQQFRLTGKLPSMGMGGAATRVQIFNRAAQMAQQSGASGEADAYTAQATHERGTAVNQLGMSTPSSAGGRVQSANALVTHLDQLSGLGTALTSGSIPAINGAKQQYMTATGNPAPTNFNAVKSIAADEAVKFIVANGGTLADREQAQKAFDGAQSPQQLAGAIQQVQHLAAGQLTGMRQRYQAIGATNEFDATLTPRTKQLLGVGQPAPAAAPPQGGQPNMAALRAKYGL